MHHLKVAVHAERLLDILWLKCNMVCRALVAPVVRGAENVPDGAVKERGVLFVGNHTQFGLYDLPFLMYELYLRGHKVGHETSIQTSA